MASVNLSPLDILPSALGLEWGMPKEVCLERLNVAPEHEWLYFPTTRADLVLPIGKNHHRISLFFDGYEVPSSYISKRLVRLYAGLVSITAELFVSRTFYEVKFCEEPPEVIDEVGDQYWDLYNDLIAVYTEALGPPAFSGAAVICSEDGTKLTRNPDYPQDQWSGHLAYWNHPEGRLQVELNHEDKELPFIISIASYAPMDHKSSFQEIRYEFGKNSAKLPKDD